MNWERTGNITSNMALNKLISIAGKEATQASNIMAILILKILEKKDSFQISLNPFLVADIVEAEQEVHAQEKDTMCMPKWRSHWKKHFMEQRGRYPLMMKN